jgi:uncharacterized iron-regulated membrane protein
MIEWHRWLGMSGDNRPLGKAITGACNLGFLFLVVSGIYLWWPKTKRTLRAVIAFDFSLKGKARDWNWHNVAGFWMAVPLFFVVLTATFFSYAWPTDLLYKATGNEPPAKAGGTPPQAASGSRGKGREAESRQSEMKPEAAAPDYSGLGNYFETATGAVAGWRTATLRMPAAPGGPLNFTVDRGSHARPDLRTQITVDAQSGSIQKTERYDSYNAARKIRLWVRWIHTGEAGGFLGQTLAGIASAAGALLVWTGLALALRRFLKRKEAAS